VTIDTFMEKLAQTPHEWRVEHFGMLRGYYNGDRCCPIQAVSGKFLLGEAFAQLGLSHSEQMEIIDVADCFDQTDLPLHARIVAATINRSAQ
jgi:hypothetical protein